MKYITTNKIFFLLGILIFTACSDDFLQKDSLSEISASTFWQSESDALSALAACYDGMQSNYLYNGDPYSCGQLNMDALTDNGGHFNWSGWMAGYDICNGTQSANSWLIADYWSSIYEIIKRCNVLIYYIDDIDMDEETIALYKAEAITLRALMYINLTMTYNDVPYLTEPLTISTANVGVTSRAEIVASVISDLQNAYEDLPTTADLGRMTQGAALAILGRIALYNEEWATAIDAYQQIVDLGVYSLYDDYSALFSTSGEESNEIILSVRYEGPGNEEGATFGAHWNTPLEAINGTMDFSDDFYCTDGLPISESSLYLGNDEINTTTSPDSARYLNRDPRLKATLWVPGMDWNGLSWSETGDIYGGATASYSTVYVRKYFDPTNVSNSWDSGQDFYICRYPEVLLSLAEALVESGTYSYSKVTSLVNQVRSRVGMPDVEDVEGASLSADDLLDLIRHERRVELGFEGFRMFDLYRWELWSNSVERINAEAKKYGFNYEQRISRGEQDYVWPIPQDEVDSNSEIEQNELW